MIVGSDNMCGKMSEFTLLRNICSPLTWQSPRQPFEGRASNDKWMTVKLCSSCVAFFLIVSPSALPSIVRLLHLFNLYPSLPPLSSPLLPSPLLPLGRRSDVNSAPQPSLAATTAHSASAMLLLRHTLSCQQQVLWVTTLRNIGISQTNGAFFGS